MKKQIFSSIRALILFILIGLFPCHSSYAQDNPANWPAFIDDMTLNVLIRDTFRMQTFENALTDNWPYVMIGDKFEVADASRFGIKNQGGDYSLLFPVGHELRMERYPVDVYKNTRSVIYFVGKNLSPNESLYVRTYRPGKDTVTLYEGSQKEKLNYTSWTSIPNSPSGFNLFTGSPVANSTAFYGVDSLFVFGEIPLFSLFRGDGAWQDTICWSHYPPARSRRALVHGAVAIDDTVSCESVSLYDGSLTITREGHFSMRNLILHDSNVALSCLGELSVDSVTRVDKTFPEKGCWYFISFPFDVYKDGIDKRFRLGDAHTTDSGNYIYVAEYDSESRSVNGLSKNNWKIVSPSSVPDGEPILNKNKGYLIALDAMSEGRMVSFSGSVGSLPANFGNTGRVEVKPFLSSGGSDSDQGWYLCANPLPSFLDLSQIKPNPDLGSHIYMYNGTDYTAYPIQSDYRIPPFSAFFLKAFSQTTLEVGNRPSVSNFPSVPAMKPLRLGRTEPVPVCSTTEEAKADFHWRIERDQVYFYNLPYDGKLRVFDLTGSSVFVCSLKKGISSVDLPLKHGIYLFSVNAGGKRWSLKHMF